MPNHNIFDEANSKICLSLIEKYFSSPDAKHDKRRNEYYTLSPLRNDEHVKAGTFSISTQTGLYNDKATGDKGNFIQLVSHKFGLTLKQAAEKIISDSGGIVMQNEKHNTHDKYEKSKPDKLPAIVPIPIGVEVDLQKFVQSEFNRNLHGKAKKIYIYKNIKQKSILCVCRYENETMDGKIEKETIPYYYTKKGWRAGRPEGVRIPLFNEDKLAGWKGDILITEGEKCASVKVEGYVNISWLGGTENVDKADWNIVKDLPGRKIIWPDFDEPGKKAALYIKSVLTDVEILDVDNYFKE